MTKIFTIFLLLFTPSAHAVTGYFVNGICFLTQASADDNFYSRQPISITTEYSNTGTGYDIAHQFDFVKRGTAWYIRHQEFKLTGANPPIVSWLEAVESPVPQSGPSGNGNNFMPKGYADCVPSTFDNTALIGNGSQVDSASIIDTVKSQIATQKLLVFLACLFLFFVGFKVGNNWFIRDKV